jgi:phosphatidylethanolamine-binding protein (PEBP) family uncharacterized protein
MTALLEVTLSYFFANFKKRDDKLFYTRPAFTEHNPPENITITSPDCGESGATLGPEYMHGGAGKFPSLEWEAPAELKPKVREWLLVSEDPDAPLPTPIAHGIYGGIAPSRTSVQAGDFEVEDQSRALLKGGFHYGVTRRGVPYIPPRPLMNHGIHRCK